MIHFEEPDDWRAIGSYPLSYQKPYKIYVTVRVYPNQGIIALITIG